MNEFLIALTAIPIIGVNVWHGLLLAMRNHANRPDSISEHAIEKPQLLLLHRIVHTASGAAFIVFALGFLLPHGYVAAALVLCVGGVLDSVEALVLNKRDADDKPTSINPHMITSWLMAACYLAYAVMITRATELNPLITSSVWIIFVMLLIVSILTKFRRFWIAQMLYFIFLAGIIAVAHIRLLSW